MSERPAQPTLPPDPLEDALRRRLYRLHCPPPEVLGEWRLGLLQAQEIQDHLTICSHCREELRWLDGLLAAGVREVVRRTLFLHPVPSLPPAFALRGAGSLSRTTYAGEGYTLTLEVTQDPRDPACRSVHGILGGHHRPHRGEAILSSASALFSAPLDDLGQFAFSQVPAGRYELRVVLEELEIRLDSLELS
ncbi:MAG: hypothetical protein QN172_00890 [Armatimonadota bacterium]|nr:hypothetical protein [Armatimonadota bacterium]MDR7439739.1 hypothetical protein [Armatimonadota bacterium]MDR7563090.1 hypothetical protein [Armatimonadota bacterium]MDR7566948.1 hypothetical protein [Armatimonadota bacterium]MDR7600994.1 hypothetical protein [Armatimonadota bacterium]